MKDFAALQPPIGNPTLSRGYRRENAHLAETVAALSPFVCEGIPLRVDFCHILRAPHGRGYGAHRHGYFELTFITESGVRYNLEQQTVSVHAGQTFLMPPGIPHGWMIPGKCGVLFGFMLEIQAGAEGATQQWDDAVRGQHHRLTLDPQIAATRRLLSKQIAARAFRADLAAPLMQALIAMTVRQVLEAHRTASANASENTLAHGRSLFERARTYLDANCEHEIYLHEVANFIGVSERQLSRLFREHDGRSVTGYVTERRLERARAMLAEGHSAKETAYACGFKDPAYFCRCFKRHTGHAPSLHL